MDDAVRNSVAIELHSNDLISNEAKIEATRVAGDPQQKALTVVNELYSLSNASQQKLLTIARALSQISAVNNIGGTMETLYWRIVMVHVLSGMCMHVCLMISSHKW